MSHPNRSRRRANRSRRQAAATSQVPLPLGQQQERAEHRMARKEAYWRSVGCDRVEYQEIPPTTTRRVRMPAIGFLESLILGWRMSR